MNLVLNVLFVTIIQLQNIKYYGKYTFNLPKTFGGDVINGWFNRNHIRYFGHDL